MPLTDMQLQFLDNCNHRWNIKTGATRSGKTFLDVLAVIPKRLFACRGEGLIVLMGNTRGTLERNIIEPMREIWGHDLVGTIRADNTVQLFGKKCYALGADNKKHVARIQGAAFEYCYGDEITTWNEDVFAMLKSRLSCPHSHFDGTCNPANPRHWFRRFLDSDADIFSQAYTIDDNPMLPPEFVDNLKREYAGTVYYDRYIRGLWVAAEGVIYSVFAADPQRFYLPVGWLDDHPLAAAIIGVDFGGNGSAHAFTLTGFTRGFRELVTLEEYYYKGERTPAQLDADFVAFCQMCFDKYPGVIRSAYCDSAEQVLINGFRAAVIRARLPLDVNNAKKGPINDRIRFLCRMIAADRYRIAAHCMHTAEALQNACWDAKYVTQDVRLDDGTNNQDSIDALEYSFEPFMANMVYIGR